MEGLWLRQILLYHRLLKQQHRDPSKAFTSGVYCSFPQGKLLENPVGFAHVGNPNFSAWSCTVYHLPSHRGAAGARGSLGTMGARRGVHQGRSGQPGPVTPPQPGEGQPGGTRAAPAPGIRHLCGARDRPRPGRDTGLQVGPAWQAPWPGRAGQGCRELETGPAVVLLGQRLEAEGPGGLVVLED